MERAATTASSLEAEQDCGSGPRCQDTILGDVDAQTRFETTTKQSNDPPLSRGYTLGSGEDNMKLLELMELCTKLSNMCKNIKSDLFWAKANNINGKRQLQALIDKKKVIITELRIRSDLHLEDHEVLNCLPTATIFEELKDGVLDLKKAKDAQAKEIAALKKRVQKLERKKKSRTERSIEDIDKDDDVSLVDDTQGRSDNEEMFDINDLHSDEVNVDMPVGEKQEQSEKEREVDTSVEDTKPKVVTTAATTTTTIRPKARGVVVQEPSEFRTPQESQPSMIKDKGKGIMIEPEVPLKRKDQVSLDEDLAINLQTQLEAELIKEERLARKKEEEANIALIESMDKYTSYDGRQIAEEKRRKPPTKAQKRNLMSTYLKNIDGYKHNQLKSKSYEEIQKMFDNEMRRVNTFIPMDSEEKEQQQESSKRQRMEDDKETDEHEEVEVDDEASALKNRIGD
ncbi:hypothetical protein Tco_1430665 [Tanacetum coccineum]